MHWTCPMHKKPDPRWWSGFMAPPVGLEPTTHGLTVRRSTDWAKGEYECWHYLSSQAVTRQVLSTQMSLTSVFGMGTGGPSSQSIPTYGWLLTIIYPKPRGWEISGDPYRNRTDVKGVRGLCLNRLTNGPCGAPSGTRTRDPLIKSQLLYQLS